MLALIRGPRNWPDFELSVAARMDSNQPLDDSELPNLIAHLTRAKELIVLGVSGGDLSPLVNQGSLLRAMCHYGGKSFQFCIYSSKETIFFFF